MTQVKPATEPVGETAVAAPPGNGAGATNPVLERSPGRPSRSRLGSPPGPRAGSTGHQVKLPPDWAGGDRLAIRDERQGQHGKAVSLGCMRAASSQARWLIESVPLGTPVFVTS